jgi:hypothetical protein
VDHGAGRPPFRLADETPSMSPKMSEHEHPDPPSS